MQIFLISFFIILFSLSSETIVLKSGKTIECQVLSQSIDHITYQPTGGKKQNLPKSVVFRILYKASPEEKKKIASQALELSKKEVAKNKGKDQKEIDEYNQLEEERIRELEKTLEEMRVEKQLKEEEEIPALKARIIQLETRLDEVETYLNLNTDWKEKHLAKRNMWSVVWRSALLPGWGNSYIDQNYVGSFYLTTFLLSAMAVAGTNSAQRLAENSHNSKVRDLFVVRPILTNFALSGANLSSEELNSSKSILSQYFEYQRINDFSKSQSALENSQMNLDNAKRLLVGIYVIQLFHAFASGMFWENEQIIPKPDEKSVSTSWTVQPENSLSPFGERRNIYAHWQINFRF